MGDVVSRRLVELALIEKGQRSKRYKLGEVWELNCDEIREALREVPDAKPERCSNCQYNLKLKKYDYSHGDSKHSDYDGFACMALASEGIAIHMVGSNPETEHCECWMPRKENMKNDE